MDGSVDHKMNIDIKTAVKIKTAISFNKYNELVDFIVDSYFSEPDNTTINFSASRGRLTKINVFFSEFVTGLELDEDLTYIEKSDLILNQERLMQHYYQATRQDGMFKDLIADVDVMVTYFNDNLLRQNNAVEEKLLEILDKELDNKTAELELLKKSEELSKEQGRQLEYLNKVNEQFTPEEQADLTRKMADSNFNMDILGTKISDIIAEKYSPSNEPR